jgi:hypothetical protein
MNTTTCPICAARMPGDWTEYPDYPFCSKRCRLIDLAGGSGKGTASRTPETRTGRAHLNHPATPADTAGPSADSIPPGLGIFTFRILLLWIDQVGRN